MADFRDPTAFSKDTSAKCETTKFRAEYPHKVWSHQVAGGEHVVALIFVANRAVEATEAKALATQLQNLHEELVQSGGMLATTLPAAEEFPAERDVFLKTTFELLAASQSVQPPE
jgi:hypothetical protein